MGSPVADPSPARLADARSLRRRLVRHGFPADVVVSEHPRSGRNHLFVVAGGSRRWFAKCCASPTEAWFYREVGPAFGWVPGAVPTGDPTITLIDYVEDAETVLDVARRDPAEALAALGTVSSLLADLHGWTPPPDGAATPRAVPALPQIDPVHVSLWLDGTEASIHLLRSFHARPLLRDALRAAIAGAGPVGVIHGDLKGDNILCAPQGPMVVDWELAGTGPVSWDVGSIIASAIAIWADSVDLLAPQSAWFASASVPYRDLCDLADEVVTAYRERGLLDAACHSSVVASAAAWLVVRSWAECQFANQVDPRHLLRLILAEGLVRNPQALFRAAAA